MSIFISPNLAIDDNNNLVDSSPQTAERAVSDLAQQAPPLYGEHQFDQLYSEVDPSGYRTPGAGSGPGTPFGTLSRNLSTENLASMNAITDTDISASALHNRLANLDVHGQRRPSPSDQDHLGVTTDHGPPSGSNTHGPPSGTNTHSPSSPQLSGRPSDEVEHDHLPSGMATPFHPHYSELETLSRVPSYSTAVRSSVRPHDRGLPNYDAVVAENIHLSAPQSPQAAYVRSGGRGTDSYFSAPMDFFHRPAFLHSRSHSHNDEERRVRLHQARGRA